MTEFFNEKYFLWKIEGDTITMLKRNVELPNAAEWFADAEIQEYISQLFTQWKNRGIKHVEIYVPPLCGKATSTFFTKQKIKIEVIKFLDSGTAFCRLTL